MTRTPTEITLHNSRTRRKERFGPLDPKNVRMYVCGPTVYDRAHLGNARPVVVFDVLFRLLRHVHGPEHVTYVRNFTDVDDKINARAREMQAAGDGRDLNTIIRALTDETIGWYHADMDALGALRPTHEPRATDFIPQMVGMIETLVAQGNAYEAEGHVLFAVDSAPGYGRLSGRSVEDMIAGARVDPAPYKRNPMDFVLWKPSSPDEPGWDGPVVDGRSTGRGRPGWHIECSAMSRELLGESFDIHGGGIDLMFPHHENEIAQSCCAHPDGDFARLWLHNEMVQVDGKKMSKSLGNFFTVRDLLDQGFPGEVIRFVMLQTHYRKPMDWTEEKADKAFQTLFQWRRATSDLRPDSGSIDQAAINALLDDLDTYKFLERLRSLFVAGEYQSLRSTAEVAGLLSDQLSWIGKSSLMAAAGKKLEEIFSIYQRAKDTKDFSEIDRIKSNIQKRGIELQLRKDRASIGSVQLIAALDFFRSMSDSNRQKYFSDAVREQADGSKSIQHEAIIWGYVAAALDESIETPQET